MTQPVGFEDKVAFVWRVADKLRGHFNAARVRAGHAAAAGAAAP